MEGDTHIHNNAPAAGGGEDSTVGVVIGVVIAVLLVVFLFMFGLPALQDSVPEEPAGEGETDINIDIVPEAVTPPADSSGA